MNEKKIYSIHGSKSSVLFLCDGNKIPEIIYWGSSLRLGEKELSRLPSLLSKPLSHGSLDQNPSIGLLPSSGDAAFSSNAISGTDYCKAWAPQFRVTEVRQEDEGAIAVFACDPIAGLSVEINFALNLWDIARQKIKLKNLSQRDYFLENLGVSFVMPSEVNKIMQFHGRWIHEFQTSIANWDFPSYLTENLKGRTSNDNPSLLIAGDSKISETGGSVYGFHLGWSGNHYYKLQTLNDGKKYVQLGEKLFPGEIVLKPGQVYETPEAFASFSSNGLNELSSNFHSFIRESGEFIRHALTYRPIHFNTWEAIYFDHKPETIHALIERSADLGIERFVLDDGWFKNRNNDKAGLGNWFVDPIKFPNGLGKIVEHVNSKGMQFGIWFEPEMINPDSDLFRQHPDWILGIEGYNQPMGRYQYVLNIAHREAFEYIYKCMSDLLREYNIGYIKWDMNRDLVQPGGMKNAPSVHAQVLALYELLRRLRAEFPGLEIESCASGGARADLGILRHTDRIWASDCNDPFERQAIQKGFSYFFPIEIMGSHFGPQNAHTTGRPSSLEYRILTNFFSHLGFEQNLLDLTREECDKLKLYLKLYKEYRPLIHEGRFIRLEPADPGQNVYGTIDAKLENALFAVAQNLLPVNQIPDLMKIPCFDPEKIYRIRLVNPGTEGVSPMRETPAICRGEIIMTGRAIAGIGIRLPIMNPQSIILLDFRNTLDGFGRDGSS